MKMFLLLSLVSFSALAGNGQSLYLSGEDQKYYKNDSFNGENQRERIDSTVKEINKMYAEMANMKAEIQALRKEVEELKQKSK